MIEEFFIAFLQEVLLLVVIKIGTAVRWFFLRNKYSYKEILEQDWNGRVGLLTIILFAFLIVKLTSF